MNRVPGAETYGISMSRLWLHWSTDADVVPGEDREITRSDVGALLAGTGRTGSERACRACSSGTLVRYVAHMRTLAKFGRER